MIMREECIVAFPSYFRTFHFSLLTSLHVYCYITMNPHKKTTQISRRNCRQCKDKGGAKRYASPLVRRHHDISHFHDPMAKPSQKVEKSTLRRNKSTGDGDIWVEKMCKSKRTGRLSNYFESTNTGTKLMTEPPTGASNVVFLKNEYVERLRLRNEY